MLLNPDVVHWTIFAIGIILIGTGAYPLYNVIRRHHILTRRLLADLGPIRSGAFVLVYFSAPTCGVCKTIQRPALEKLSGILGDSLQVFEIDVTKEPDLAQRWAVKHVPATFLITPHGELHHANQGVVRAEHLLIQLHS
jgi:thiol-disulfide isomerase/thioredoxin